MILKHINDITSICVGHGVKTAIISPGSRSAPLTLAFVRHPKIETKVIPDERSAAFIAMGIAQQQNKPVVLICTSGSAAYNYAPAIAEAYFQEIPLLVLTADRPPEWINQYDGQTIQQSGLYGKHVKKSWDFPSIVDHKDIAWHCNRITNEALLVTTESPQGPVHINVPFREPFYPSKEEVTSFNQVRLIQRDSGITNLSSSTWNSLNEAWEKYDKKLIVAGQHEYSSDLINAIDAFSVLHDTPIVADGISNLHDCEHGIRHQDAFLSLGRTEANAHLVPDLLITIGKSLISKNLKLFLRNSPPKVHWHISTSDRLNDSLQHVSELIKMDPANFFESFVPKESSSNFRKKWENADQKSHSIISQHLNDCEFGEFKVVQKSINALPALSQLHLANSMAVRYANLSGVPRQKSISVFSNRGTSGIDGCNSTAVGAALAKDEIVTLITGDMAFFYDRNAFWHNYNLKNLRVIILNNHGGGIFRLIPGPSSQPELAEYFETEQLLNAENTAKDFGFKYERVSTEVELDQSLIHFFDQTDTARILEIETDSEINDKVFSGLKQKITNQI